MINHKISLGLASLTIPAYYIYNTTNVNKTIQKYTYNEVKQHTNKTNGYWVTYKDNIYDITDYIDNHPGGKEKILSAAGGPLEPYWNLYRQHLDKDYIFTDILEKRKIGVLSDYNVIKSNSNSTDPYLNDPTRDLNLIFHQIKPCNAETPHDKIMDNWITPNSLWYIRNHHPVPLFNCNTISYYRLYIGENEFSINYLKKKYPNKKIITTMQCGGNRRSELNDFNKTSGTTWSYGAISTAVWEGVALHLLLQDIFTQDQIDKNKYINCTSYDDVKVSIPLNKVMNPNGDVLLAYKMNGEDIPKDHGYPLRLIVPGYVGVRNLKWIKTISLSREEIVSPWQTGISYKALPSYLRDLTNIDISKYPSINNLPVQSVVVNVERVDNLIKTMGFAWSGGGNKITRVDVSPDSGKTWEMARLTKGKDQPDGKAWAWTFWEKEFRIDIDKDIDNKIVCKSTDSSLSTQPEKLEQVWNIRGLCNNSWFQYPVNNKDL